MKVDTLLKVIPRHLDVITIQESENIKFSTLTDSWDSAKEYGECYVKEILPLNRGGGGIAIII